MRIRIMLKAMSQLRSRAMVMAACFAVIVVLSADYALAGPRGRAVSLSRPGRVVVKLPAGYRTVVSRGVKYFYQGGIFYRQASSGYVLVEAPVGAIVASLPAGREVVWVEDTEYYLYDGMYYAKVPAGFKVVSPPSEIVQVAVEKASLVQPPESNKGKIKVTTSLLNVRSGPSLAHPVIHQVEKNTILETQGRASEWLYVKLPNEQFGWVKEEFTIKLGQPASG
jgi:hypothetical protein